MSFSRNDVGGVGFRNVQRMIVVLVVLVSLVASGCSGAKPQTNAFIDAPAVSAMAPASNGGLLWANGHTGQIFAADKNGKSQGAALVTLPVAADASGAVTGLATDLRDKTFAAWLDPQQRLTVGQVSPGSLRILWQGPQVSAANLGGRLTVSSYNRLILSVGDIGDVKANGISISRSLLSLDPNGSSTQIPNVISTGWNAPNGIAYSTDNIYLWVADDSGEGKGHLSRSGPDGPTGTVTAFDTNAHPAAMTRYGDQELAICFSGNHQLKRYLLNGGTEAVPGRVLAQDCQAALTQLKDGRLAYATADAIRVTLL